MSGYNQCCPKDYSLLDVDYTFELIPDTPATAAAGYTAETRAQAQTWYGPVVDGKYFYYTAWSGSILGVDNLSSIFVCRERATGKLMFAVNCQDYNLDTSANYLGQTKTICRCKPVILEDKVYLCNALMSNLGAQLYAINKRNGSLIWAAAYRTPGDLGYVTQQGDYGAYVGSNMNISDLNPIAYKEKDGYPRIIVGVSSFQNTPLNVGTITGGYPVYTDQGALVCIKDLGASSALDWKTETCAPLLKRGNMILKGGDPTYDPFRPNSNVVRLVSKSEPGNYFENVYFLSNPTAPGTPNTTPILTKVNFTKDTPITASLVQRVWRYLPAIIYQDTNKTDAKDLQGWLDAWRLEQDALPEGGSVRHDIWAYINEETVNRMKSRPGNNDIIYFKYMTSGQIIQTDQDAQGLNYYGNSTWGAPATLDRDSYLIFFGCGQAHDSPLDETLEYQSPERDWATLKVPVVDAITAYQNGTGTLEQVENQKDIFASKIRALALDLSIKSPRGNRSYSDAIMASYRKVKTNYGFNVPGSLAFGVRSVPIDNYSFLTNFSGILPSANIDGDASSGVSLFGESTKLASTPTKGGLGEIVNYTGIKNNILFTDTNLIEKGISTRPSVYNGPNGLLGGSNFQAGSNPSFVFSAQANTSWFGGNVGSQGQLELFVKQNGTVLQQNNAVLQAYKPRTSEIVWESEFFNRANAQVLEVNGNVFFGDLNGNLYVYESRTGVMTWKGNGKGLGMGGGIAEPAVTEDGQVLWINSYNAFGIAGNGGPNGVSFRSNQKINPVGLPLCTLLNSRTFVSWDTAPKLNFANPAINPINSVTITNAWNTSKTNKFVVHATHVGLDATNEYDFVVKSYNSKTKTLVFVDNEVPGALQYQKLVFINAKKYVLYYTHGGVDAPVQQAWLELQ